MVKEGNLNQLGSSTGRPFKQFESVQTLIQTVPKKPIKTLNEFKAKHDLILPSVLPENCDHSTYSFDWNSAVFNGPFVTGTELLLEQQQTDRPMFMIVWDSNNSENLRVYFFNPSRKGNCKYSVHITAAEAYLRDWTNRQNSYHYNLNSDGSLGSLKIV